MSSLFGGGTSTSTQTVDNSPWKTQQPYLQGGFEKAADIAKNQIDQPPYDGELYSRLNPTQLAALSSLNDYSVGPGSTYGTNLNTAAGALSGYGQHNLFSTDIAKGGALDALNGNGGSVIQKATNFANNPWTQGMIDKANAPIEQQLREVALPGNEIKASMSGNTDSSRAGVTDALLRRNAAQAESNNASSILGTQYDNGLQLAKDMQLGGIGALSGIGQTGASELSAAAPILQAANQADLTNLNIPLQTGGVYQSDQQKQDEADYNKYQLQNQHQWDVLNNYWNIVGHPLGNTSTQQTTQTGGGPGVLGGLLGLASGVGSFFAPGSFGAPSIFKSIFG